MRRAIGLASLAMLVSSHTAMALPAYSLQYEGPSTGGTGGSSGALVESIFVDRALSGNIGTFWSTCGGDFVYCNNVEGHVPGGHGVKVASPWEVLDLNINDNAQRFGFSATTEAGAGEYFEARATATFDLELTADETASLGKGTELGKRIVFSGPDAYVTRRSPELITGSWSSFFDHSAIPFGFEATSETLFSVIFSVVDSGLNQHPTFSDVVLYSGSYSGSGSAGFSVRTADLLAGVDPSVYVGTIRLVGEQRLNLIAAPIPEPSTYALMLAGLGAVALGMLCRTRASTARRGKVISRPLTELLGKRVTGDPMSAMRSTP